MAGHQARKIIEAVTKGLAKGSRDWRSSLALRNTPPMLVVTGQQCKVLPTWWQESFTRKCLARSDTKLVSHCRYTLLVCNLKLSAKNLIWSHCQDYRFLRVITHWARMCKRQLLLLLWCRMFCWTSTMGESTSMCTRSDLHKQQANLVLTIWSNLRWLLTPICHIETKFGSNLAQLACLDFRIQCTPLIASDCSWKGVC